METMTPAEVGAWLAAHGGPAGGDGPDANGVIVQRAADGSSITTKSSSSGGLQVVDKQEKGPTQGAAPAAASQPSSGVGTVTQKDLEARVAQNPSLVYRGQTTKTKTTGADQFGAGSSIQVPVLTWVDPATGQTLEAEVQPGGGSYSITTDAVVPSNKGPASQTASAEPPKEKDEGGRRYQWQPNAGGANAGGKWVDVGPAPLNAAERAEADKNKGTTVLKPDGKGGTNAVTTYPDGRTPTVVPVPGVPSEVAQRYGQVKQDPQTGAWSGLTNGGQWEPISGGPGIKKSAKMPPGVTPPSSFEYGTAATKLADFWRQLNEAVSRGDITGEDAAALFAPYHQQAESAVAEQTGILNTQRGIMQDQTSERGQDMTQANTRATVASGLFNNSMANFTKLNDYLPAGSDAGGQAFLASLKLGQGYVDGFGGLKESPRTPFLPAVEQAMQATLPSGAPNLGASAAAATNTFNTRSGALVNAPPAPAASSQSVVPGPASAAGAPPPPLPANRPDQTQAAPQIEDATMPVPPPDSAPIFSPAPSFVFSPPQGTQGMLPGVQAAMNRPDPSMVAGNLLALGFDPDVVDAVHQQRYGRSMYGRQAA